MNSQRSQGKAGLQWAAERRRAAPEDFCAIFDEEMNTLYSLAFLLTADSHKAEDCFVAALEDCLNASEVFPEWVRSWSRRAIIKQAIGRVRPRPEADGWERTHKLAEAEDIPGRLLQLRPFERFVFGMNVLERYTARECAVLLGCHAREVEEALQRSLQFLGGSAALVPPSAARLGQQGPEMANITASI